MNNETVSLTISKEIVNPIVETKVKEAILAALGGPDKIIEKVVNEVLNRKVDLNGNTSTYSSDNKYSWIDAVVTKQIKTLVEKEVTEIVGQQSSVIKDEIIKQLKTNKGANKVASALLDAFNGTFGKSWLSTISIDFKTGKD